ncbi:hypothetical protein [Pandoraea anhela]|uniref:Uncharacterized protein n=1 Tax=Pandoraea anhela TaxID=2508295 RepID=A0A5E4TLB4_9BURK|nr:hypothetical protein [Pandoraea anhela]VVD87354.1 hypothetical protein PAN31108_01446 [Pandoraea anhela]
MATRTTSVKIPHNPRIVRARGGKRPVSDAVVPSVKGLRSVTPSTLGIQDRARLGKCVKAATTLAAGLDALITCRDSGYPELEALARDPRFVKAIAAAIQKISTQVDSIIHPSAEGNPDDAAGLISRRNGQDGGSWFALDHETRLQREAAAKRAVELRATMEMDTPQNIARIRLGLAPVSVNDEALYAMFEGKE